MKRITYLLILLTLVIDLSAQTLTKEWEVSGLEAPESAVFYEGNYYVSNVAGQPAEKNGLGYLTKIDENGKISIKKWVEGFNAPKGLAVLNGQLYVADIDRVAVVDIASGEITKWHETTGATFLNDIEVVDDKVYISDTFGGNAIYVIEDEQISLWLKDEKLNYPNGLMKEGNKLLVASWGIVTDPSTFGTETPGKLMSVDLKTKKIKDVSPPTGNLDGLIQWKKAYIASDWIAGGILTIDKKGNAEQILDLNAGSADLTYQTDTKLLLVPQMLDGKLTAFKVE